jgi:rifampicin phosphotransferase
VELLHQKILSSRYGGNNMKKYILHFNEIDKSSLPYVGGKGANLGEMTKAEFPVPQGFCVTTWAYKTFIQNSNEMNKLLSSLEEVSHTDLEQISILGKTIRNHIETITMPDDIKYSILDALKITGIKKYYAVRSSATAEDLPTASFAGQQDTYLNVFGEDQLLKAVQKCWASLFTDRAISYRTKNKFNHKSVFISVVVQEMVLPDVSGIMFTADPINGHRKTISIDASFGLGEALVSGIVTADLYQVRSDEIIKKQISSKKVAIYSLPEGGTVTKDIPFEQQDVQALSDDKIIELSKLGQKIESHYNCEQDIEWAFADGKFYILQSRPITSLYPVPTICDDKLNVFISFGHIQVMTDAMKPLNISLFKNILNFLRGESSSMDYFIFEAGGRMFANVTPILLLKPVRHRFLKVFNKMDELIVSALLEVVKKEDFINRSIHKNKVLKTFSKLAPIVIPVFIKVLSNILIKNPTKAENEVNSLIETISKESEKNIFESSGSNRIRKVKESMGNMVPNVISKVVPYIISGIIASGKLEKKLKHKVGDKKCAYLLSQLNKSLPGNVTTELGLEVADLADIARNYPEVIDYLEKVSNETFYEGLIKIKGGLEFKDKFEIFLSKYGMRCSGEIDITKPRWYEEPIQLVPSILSNIRTSTCGEHRVKFKQGEIEAAQATKEIISQFSGFEKIVVSRLINLYRNLMGMREHHKFAVILQLNIYKRGILDIGGNLVKKGILKNEKDIFYFTLDELIELEENRFSKDVDEFINKIKKQYEQYEKLTPPRVITSEGEIITGRIKDIHAPEGALIGIPVSAGIVEGVARVITRLEDAKLNPGEILVAPFTDPGWTPLFTSAIGLITEVGGTMTHGSVIAREYGIPAVVGIDKATELIKNGAYIRVNGTEGYVEILEK